MAMLSLLKLILISTGLTCVRTRTSMGDEAIVVRVHDGGVEDPVHLDEPRLLVQLVLDLAPLGDLHDLLIEERSRISQPIMLQDGCNKFGWLGCGETGSGCLPR